MYYVYLQLDEVCIFTMVCIMSTDNLIAKLAIDMVVATRHENSTLQYCHCQLYHTETYLIS